MADITIYDRLKRKGMTHKEFVYMVMQTGVCASYSYIDKHCRALDRSYGRSDVWEAIDKILDKMEVKQYGR